MRGAPIRSCQRAPMPVRPRLDDFGRLGRLGEASLGGDRDCQPAGAIRTFDPIAIVPMARGELNTVEDDVLVAPADQIKETLPRDVAGLNDRDTFGSSRHQTYPSYAQWIR